MVHRGSFNFILKCTDEFPHGSDLICSLALLKKKRVGYFCIKAEKKTELTPVLILRRAFIRHIYTHLHNILRFYASRQK